MANDQPIEPGTVLSGTGLTLDYGPFKTVLYQFFLFVEEEANQEWIDLQARLYEMSPELLAAAKEVAHLLRAGTDPTSRLLVERLDQLIARAEGGDDG